MSETGRLTRRQLLTATAKLSAVAGAAIAGFGCGKSTPGNFSCSDTTGMHPNDVAARKAQEYSDASPIAEKTCAGCKHYEAPPKEGSCGTCKVLKGSVHPKGYCKLFLAKETT
jgi:hypothetical protein